MSRGYCFRLMVSPARCAPAPDAPSPVEAIEVMGDVGDIAGPADGGIVHVHGADAHVFRSLVDRSQQAEVTGSWFH